MKTNMRSSASNFVAPTIAFTWLLFGCGANVVFGEGSGAEGGQGGSTTITTGANGNGGFGAFPDGPGPGPGPGPGVGGSTTDISPVTTTGPQITCDQLGACQGDGVDPKSGCLECAALGDTSVASDGGACGQPYLACFGTEGDCSNGLPDCCDFSSCLDACSQLPNDQFLDCVCTNDGNGCFDFPQQQPGTCFGDHLEGAQSYIDFYTCAVSDVCPFSCGQ